MKKLILITMMLMALAAPSVAQVIEDFEAIPMNLMLGGSNDSSSMMIVPNPDKSGIDTSEWVVKFVRSHNGVPWGGFFSNLPTPIDITTNKYIHAKVWKPRVSPLHFKVQGGTAGDLEIPSINPQATTNAWEEIVFDFSTKTGTYPIISFMPDFEDPLTLTSDIVIYFDDIYLNNDPTPGSAPANVIEDYEFIKMNLMMGDPLVDSSSIVIVMNPDRSGIDTSNWVGRLIRDYEGVPWEGFFTNDSVDLTTNKYFHAKAWKPRISPLKMKVQGGTAGDLEIFSTNTQTMTMGWEDFVFDFSSKTGWYPIWTFMPDFQDPITTTTNDTIYFDDFILNNSPDPYTGIRKYQDDGRVMVYPVPCFDYLNIRTLIPVASVTVSNIAGQQLMKLDHAFRDFSSVNTSQLAPGMYFVTVTPQNGKAYLFRVMKQ